MTNRLGNDGLRGFYDGILRLGPSEGALLSKRSYVDYNERYLLVPASTVCQGRPQALCEKRDETGILRMAQKQWAYAQARYGEMHKQAASIAMLNCNSRISSVLQSRARSFEPTQS